MCGLFSMCPLRWLVLGLWLCVSVLALPTGVSAQTGEYAMKAMYLERFTRFIEWPDDAADNDSAKLFVVTVIGKNPFEAGLEKAFSDNPNDKRRVEIRYASNISEIDSCHILFIAGDRENEVPEILKAVAGRPILTVGDTEGFCEEGVLINLYLADGKVRFEINESVAITSPLTLSYHLLKMAKIVTTPGEKK